MELKLRTKVFFLCQNIRSYSSTNLELSCLIRRYLYSEFDAIAPDNYRVIEPKAFVHTRVCVTTFTVNVHLHPHP